MNTIIQKVSFISIVACTSLEKTFAGIFGPDIIDKRLRGSDATLDIAGQTIVGNLMFFLGIVAVIYGIYGGFLILTAGGEDDKVKKENLLSYK